MKILFADDHQLILTGLKTIISDYFSEASIYMAQNKSELFAWLKKETFDILIQDLKFGDTNANEFLTEIKKDYPKLKILILSTISDTVSITKLIKKVDGYVVKSEPIEEIITAIKTICEGKTYLSKKTNQKLKAPIWHKEIILSRREKEIIAVIMKEKSTKEIAEELNISVKTVEMHRANLFVKLEVKNITGLVKKIILLGLIED